MLQSCISNQCRRWGCRSNRVSLCFSSSSLIKGAIAADAESNVRLLIMSLFLLRQSREVGHEYLHSSPDYRLCRDYASAGLSPYAEDLATLKSKITIPIYVMIRPHANGFFYNDADFEEMKATLAALENAHADGYVFGILNTARSHGRYRGSGAISWIDLERNKELVKLAKGKPCTFHRAFDCIPEYAWDAALADIAECGFTSILTSGGPSSDKAITCVEKLVDLHARLRISQTRVKDSSQLQDIIVAGGVRGNNIHELWSKTRARVFHSSALSASNDVVDTTDVVMLKNLLLGAFSSECGGNSRILN